MKVRRVIEASRAFFTPDDVVEFRGWDIINNRAGVIQPVVIKELKEEEKYDPAQAFLTLRGDEVQYLMDSLFRLGIRPREMRNTVDEISAIKDHLRDMRLIAFDRLKIKMEKPNDKF